MSSEHFVRTFLKIPDWYVLLEEEIEYLHVTIVENNKDMNQIYWTIMLDCSASCNGCYFCGDVSRLCECSSKSQSRSD